MEALSVDRERWKGWETALEILSGILYWLLVWFLAGIPGSLVLAQLLKAASEELEREETEGLLGIRRFRHNEETPQTYSPICSSASERPRRGLSGSPGAAQRTAFAIPAG